MAEPGRKGFGPGEKPVPVSVDPMLLGQMFVIVDSGCVVRGMGVRLDGNLAEIGHPTRSVGMLDVRPGDWDAAELDRYVADRPGWQVFAAHVTEISEAPSMPYAVKPNVWGCYDPQCGDSTWDHDCPVVPPRAEPLAPTPCPTCGLPGGFHDDAGHAVARAGIPPELTRPGNRQARRISGGVELTEERIAELAAEAEAGYPVDRLREWPRRG